MPLGEALCRSVLDALDSAVVVIDSQGLVVTVNPASCALFGADAASLIGQHFSAGGWQFMGEEAHPVVGVLEGGARMVERRFTVRRADGSLRNVSVNAAPVGGAAGDPAPACVMTLRDLGTQQPTTRALAEDRWKHALDGSGDGVWDFDEDSGRAFFSRRWKQMLGHEDDEIGDSPQEWLQRVHPQDKRAVLGAIERYRTGESPAYHTEYRMRHKDGHWLWVLDRGRIVERRADGSVRRVVGVQTDITARKVAEQALRDQQAAELARLAKSEFLSRVSHEMRTPLNAMIGFTQLLRLQPDGGGAARVAQYTEHVLRASEHLLALVNDVLDLQRVEGGHLALHAEALALGSAVDAALASLQPLARRHEVAMQSQVGVDILVQADARRLRQVLDNVLSNAVKYNRAGGWVRVGLEDGQAHEVVLSVLDSGPGLSAAQLQRLFEPFERLGRETSAIEGTGLGLVIARRLVEEMGGNLSLSSAPGSGTLARIALPRAVTGSGGSVAGEAAQVAPPARPPLRMLYVEDNRINAILFEEALRLRGGVELRVAEDGAEALALVQEWPPEVLVLDAHLPDMTGYDVLRQLRELPALSAAPAFMCSADASAQDKVRAAQAGFIGYWTKPIDVNLVIGDLDRLALQRA